MREVKIKVFKFDELREDAKKQAIEWYQSGCFGDWWEYTYEDAERIGCKIKGFDLNCWSIDFDFVLGAREVALKVIAEHGAECDTFKAAKSFLSGFTVCLEDEEEKLAEVFRLELGGCYLSMLKGALDWEESEEKAVEDIRANEYDFTADGKRFHLG